MDPLARSDLEFELESWLDDRGVPDAWELSPTLVELGYDPEKLERWSNPLRPSSFRV